MFDDDMCLNLGISSEPPAPIAPARRNDEVLPGYPEAAGPMAYPPVVWSASPGLGYWGSRKWFCGDHSPLGW